ncbi:MAG: haloalkane dehalogenase [bacterium]|nr:haloalkane dehalogenase [bacterium]MYB10821.1 alpha/beta fold hydrolase [Acidimicrobiia bacterium]MYG58874.1 alpha/beta fold hydrolase [Acidimicrobiia bacterium]MYH94966.1 alpha/beta fold hydrolase [Acidimicrobiia bacterium]MYJ33872.1 alpha/beta fold hydrolase [Acidimicrobiia bacterium]
MAFVRTPEERFGGIDDYPYEPRYVDIDGLRMAYVLAEPEGAGDDTATILLLHGEPTWGYLYRKMIPPLVAGGCRVLVPDLIGFGRSDKPVERSAYTYEGHVEWMRQFLAATAAERSAGPLHLFGQDWGGLIGLRVAAENPDLIDRLILANTGLPEGQSPGAGFEFWLQFSQEVEYLDCGRLVDNATANELSEAAQEAYRAPFPDEAYMAGARHFPMLVPISPEDPAVPANRAAWQVLEQWTKPVLTLWAPDDPVLGGGQAAISERIPGAAGQPHDQFRPASHFIQEDQGPALAEAIVTWLS